MSSSFMKMNELRMSRLANRSAHDFDRARAKLNWARARRAVRAHLFVQRLKRISTWKRSPLFDESREDDKPHWFVLLPESRITRTYNIITAGAVLFVGFSIFLSLGFAQYLPTHSVHNFELFIDYWFWVDLGLNLITAFYHNGKIVTHPSEIIAHYLKTWFVVDFLGNLPMEQMTPYLQHEDRMVIKVLKFLKIPRLLRLARLRRILEGKGKYLNLIIYLCLACLCIHAAGCLWMLMLAPCEEFPPICPNGVICKWKFMEDIDPFLVITDPKLGPECLPSALPAIYTMALSYGTSMVLGYGGVDIGTIDGGHYRTREMSGVSMAYTVANDTPTTLTLHDLVNVSPFPPNSFGDPAFMRIWILATVVRMLGYVIVAFLTGVIIKIELNASYRETVFRRHVEAIESELASFGSAIPEPLMRRVKEHISESWHTGDLGKSTIAKTDIFSAQLKGELIAALNKDVLMKVSFFRSATFEAIQQLCMDAEDRKFLPGELIFRRGEVSTGLYLIRSGTVVMSPLSSSWSSMSRAVDKHLADGDRTYLSEPRDDGTRPMRSSFLRMRRKARAFRKTLSMRRAEENSRGNQSESPTFPLTTGSWFGECELLRELVLGGRSNEFRRTTSAEAKTLVRAIFVPKESLEKILLENPQILTELLLAHQKRYNSTDMPRELRNAFRFSDEWDLRVTQIIQEMDTLRRNYDQGDDEGEDPYEDAEGSMRPDIGISFHRSSGATPQLVSMSSRRM